MRYAFSIVVLLAVAGLSIWFALRNAQVAPPIDLLITTLPAVPAWMALLGAAAVGAGVSILVVIFPLLRLKVRVRRQARAIHELEQEIHGLRTLPLDEETLAEEAVQER